MAQQQQAVPGTLKEGMKDGWFTELSTMWPGQGMSFKVNEVIHTARSDFQVRLVVDGMPVSFSSKGTTHSETRKHVLILS